MLLSKISLILLFWSIYLLFNLNVVCFLLSGDSANISLNFIWPKSLWPKNVIFDEDSVENLIEQNGNPRFFYVTKPTKKEKGEFNLHPTVKPIRLMKYLCKLTKTPHGGKVLDPFGGSGTTALGCIEEGREFVIIDREKEYFEIGEKRINKHLKNNL